MGKSKASRAREAEKATKRREKRIRRNAENVNLKLGGAGKFGIVMAGTREGYDALVHPSLENGKLVGVVLTPVGTASSMVAGGGPESLLPQIRDVMSGRMLFVLGAHKDRPGDWLLLVGGKSEPLRPAREGFALANGGYGPPEEFDYLVEILAGVAEQFDREPRVVATDLINSVIGQATAKWPNWEAWAQEHRPDIIDFAENIDL